MKRFKSVTFKLNIIDKMIILNKIKRLKKLIFLSIKNKFQMGRLKRLKIKNFTKKVFKKMFNRILEIVN